MIDRSASNAAAASPVAAPTTNGAAGDTWSQSTPASTLATTAVSPIVVWYSPRNVPRLSGGAASEISARATPSVSAIANP